MALRNFLIRLKSMKWSLYRPEMVYLEVSPDTVTPDSKLLSPWAEPIAMWNSVMGDSVSENPDQLQTMDWSGCTGKNIIMITAWKYRLITCICSYNADCFNRTLCMDPLELKGMFSLPTWIYWGHTTDPDCGVLSSTTIALVVLLLTKPTLFSAQILMMLGFPWKKKSY